VRYCLHCPKCDSRAQCPSGYRLTIEGLQDDWLVDVIDADGRPVKVNSRRANEKLELELTFDPDAVRKGGLENYALRFTPRSKASIGREYRLRTSLEAR
jgi:hypothetical protein